MFHHEGTGGSQLNVRSLVLRHGSWASIGTALNLVFALLSTVILARVLSPTDFGRFTIARTGLSFLGVFATFGLGTVALGMLGRYASDVGSSRRRHVMTRVAVISMGSLTIGAITAFAASLLFGETLTGGETGLLVAIVFALGTIASGVLNIVSDSVRGTGSPAAANMLGNVMQGSPAPHAGTLLTVAVLSYVGLATWQNAIMAYAASAAIAAGCGCLVLWSHLKPGETVANDGAKGDQSLPSVVDVLSCAWPLAIASMISFTTSSCDLFMTSEFSDPDSMAYYVAARRVIVLLAIPLSVLNTAARGVISPLYSANLSAQLEKHLRQGAGLAAIPCMLAALLVLIMPEFVLKVVLGDGYDEASTILRILIPGQVMLVVSGSCAALLRLSGFQRVMLIIDVVTALSLVVLGPLVAAGFGAIGLAVLVSSLQIALNVVTWATAWKLTGINTWCSFRVVSRFRSLLAR
ncbi:MAG: oligosaccharide flippase family protein [Planctomycetaceae bacterium]